MDPWLETRFDPLFVQVFPRDYTPEELHAGFDRVEAFYLDRVQRNPSMRALQLSDMSHVVKSNAKNRRRIAQCFNLLAEPLRGRLLGQAFVLPRPWMRHAMTAIFWVRQPAWPVKAFATHEEALAWLQVKGKAEGVVFRMPEPWWNVTSAAAAPPP